MLWCTRVSERSGRATCTDVTVPVQTSESATPAELYPALHVHVVEPELLLDPTGHAVHCAAPEDGLYVSASQSVNPKRTCGGQPHLVTAKSGGDRARQTYSGNCCQHCYRCPADRLHKTTNDTPGNVTRPSCNHTQVMRRTATTGRASL
jgi:hypothetical protein